MGTESEVIRHTVKVGDAKVTRFGFGIELIAAVHSFWPERVRTFEEADDLLASPFNVPATSKLYVSAVALKSQDPSPPSFKVGKLTGAVAQSVELVPATPTAGAGYSLEIDGQAVTVIADSTPTLAEVTAALTTAISALADVTAVDGTTKVTVNADTAAVRHAIEVTSGNITVKEVTALGSPSVATDLAAIEAIDGDWYMLHLVNASSAAIKDAAAWCEAADSPKLFIGETADSGVLDQSITTDVASDLMTAGYNRTGVLYHHRVDGQQPAAAWGGGVLPKLPGPITFANKGLVGVDVSPLDATARTALKAKRANYYIAIKGLGFTLKGAAASGRFFDVTVAMDWFDVSITDRIVLLLRNNDIVPYTLKGMELVLAQLEAQILEGGRLGIIDVAQGYSVTGPKLADINPADKGDRILPNVGYNYTLSGAIHSVEIAGVVEV